MISANGLIHISQDSGYSSEILETHNLEERNLSEFGGILVGNVSMISDSSKERLVNYVKNGGSLLIASPNAAALFGFQICNPESRLIHICDGESLAPLQTVCADFKNAKLNGETVGEYYLDNYKGSKAFPAAKTTHIGKGIIISLCFDLGTSYIQNRTSCIRNFFRHGMNLLFPNPLVTIEGSNYAELVITRKNEKIYINLLNYAGEHNVKGVRSYNEIPALGPIIVRINENIPLKEVYIEPAHKRWDGSLHKIIIEKLEVHVIIELTL